MTTEYQDEPEAVVFFCCGCVESRDVFCCVTGFA